jgi:predicted permease
MSWLSRLRNALHPQRLDDELAEELRDHLERRAAALRDEGAGPADARRQATLGFGNVALFREQSRDIRLWPALESTIQDARYAWRGMRKSPAFTVTAVLSLSLAIGSITAMYSIVDAALLRPLPVPEPDRLFTLAMPEIDHAGQTVSNERELFDYPLYLQLRAAAQDSARLALFRPADRVEGQLGDPDAPVEKITEQFVSGEAFDILRVPSALGRVFSAEDDGLPGVRVVVLSHDYWRRRFNLDPGVLGQRILLDGRPCNIVGVAGPGFSGVEPGKFVDVWLPASSFDPGAFSNPDSSWLTITGRLTTGATREQLQARLQPSFHHDQESRVTRNPTMSPAMRQRLLDMAIRVNPGVGASDFRRTFARPLWIVFGVAVGILVIACANVASLLLARSSARTGEMALRVSLGAARSRLVRLLLTESLLLSVLSGALAWLLARLAAPLLVRMLSTGGDPVRFALAVDARVLAFCAGVCALSTVSFGMLPAWQAAGVRPIQLLRRVSSQGSRLRMGRLFVSAQVAFAFCLVIAGAAFLFTLRNLTTLQLGFDPKGVAVLTIGVRSNPIQNGLLVAQQLQTRVADFPDVQAVAYGWWAMFDGRPRMEHVRVAGKPPSGRDEIFARVSPGYLAALKIPLLAGRDFNIHDNEGGPRVPTIVNQGFARRYFGSDAVVGREFQRADGTTHQIVGVAASAYYSDLRSGPEAIAFFPMKPPRQFALYVRSTVDPGPLAQRVEREARALGAGTHVVEVTTLDTLVGNTLRREKLLAGLGGVFAALGLLLAAIGLFGLLNYTVLRRTKEIGIRAALGARPLELVGLVLRDLYGMLAGGMVVGLMGAFALMRVTRSLLFGVGAADPLLIGSATVVFLVTALVAGGLPARRVAAIDPIAALARD